MNTVEKYKIKVHGDFQSQATNYMRDYMWDAVVTLKSREYPAKLEPCPAATETDIHANHTRNDRPGHPTSHPGSHFSRLACQPVSLPAQQAASYPTRGSTPVPAQTDRLGQIGTTPPPLPPTLPLHCALQQPLLRGLIPRSDHHLYLLC